jgi:hypothetical protein
MKISVLLTALLFFFCLSKGFSQPKKLYFKASQAYITFGSDDKLKGPIDCDDYVTINPQQGEITFLSSSTKVYKIIRSESKKADNNNPYIEYTAKDKEDNQIILSVVKIIEKKENNIRIAYMNIDGSGLMVLEGNAQKVF